MDFEWDADKDAENLAKHGISFEEAAHIFDGPILTKMDDREDYGEMREITMGMLSPDAVRIGGRSYGPRRQNPADFCS